jgi:mRNA interferase MazF
MISSQTRQYTAGFDEVIQADDPDFVTSGLKVSSVIRVGRLAVVDGRILLGAIGEIDSARLQRIKTHLADWLMQS